MQTNVTSNSHVFEISGFIRWHTFFVPVEANQMF